MEQRSSEKPRQNEVIGRIRGGAKGWREIAAELCSVEDQGLWKSEANSFDAWVSELAAATNMQVSAMLRYLAGERSIRHLAGAYPDICNKESVRQICRDITLENIEGLMELETLVPRNRFCEVLSEVVGGTLLYKSLKAIIESCRPIDKGNLSLTLSVLKGSAIVGPKDYP
ncbi:hypothetical protein KP001_09015 [Geomonas subterranea]|uniref:Uncharacterized protein n=1 Tax=Geomonas subterranea TaxID=2847989 RepID=A0ABX8LLS5_9BACT|nr:hypothetical protein [Geomonas subterranea]QXE92638.1 hypothetical protein KP001_09015 [Geomonas subterranea]QXM09263.1 hypothetical protein KP002_20260 [Geomonas subterranea]